MITEQKLREALKLLLASGGVISEASANELQAAIDDPDAEEIVKVQAAAVLNARQALATTEPEPTGMPELPEPDSYEFQHEETGNTMFVDRQQVEWGFEKNNPRLQKIAGAYTTSQMRAYGEQCWKAGYKHGAWGDKPAVNQQLTTELDERAAFESEMRSRHGWNNSYFTQSNDGGYLSNRATHAYIGWQARAAMAQVGDINVAESFTSVTKTAAPVGERGLPPLPSYARWEERIKTLMQQCGHPNSMSIYQAFKQFQNEFEHEMIAYARAALSAGDAVDAQRYRWLLDNYAIGDGYDRIDAALNDGNADTHLSPAIDAAADAAVRKGQL